MDSNQILALIAQSKKKVETRPIEKIEVFDDQYSLENLQKLQKGEIDYLVFDQSLDFDPILAEIDFLIKNGFLKAAGVGKDESYSQEKSIRDDKHCWIGPAGGMKKEQVTNIQAYVESMRTKIYEDYNQKAAQKLDSTSTQLAIYSGPSSTGYKLHKDAFLQANLKDGQKLRKLTLITYFSDNQTGSLNLYTPSKILTISPKKGRTVLFLSENLEHSVEPMTEDSRIALTIWFNHTYKKPIKEEKDKIFIGIPCYRDREVIPTIRSLITSSSNPESLIFGIFLQISISLEGDIAEELIKIQKEFPQCKFRILTVDISEAKNAYYARYMVQKLYNNETYYLQIDCHMRFCKDWDSFLISQLSDPKLVLSCYPSGYELGQPQEVDETPLKMCFTHFSEQDGLPRFKSSKNADKPFDFWAAGFSFSYGKIIEQCPYQKGIENVFFGEEHYQMYLMWTQGYHISSPSKNVCSHLWERRHVCQSDFETQRLQVQKLKDQIMKDEKYVAYMLSKGLDLVNKKYIN